MKEYEPDFEILEPPRLDKNGVTVVYKTKEGQKSKINFNSDKWENDQWLDELKEIVAKRYAKLERKKEKQGHEMKVTQIEKESYEGNQFNVKKKVEKEKKKIKDREDSKKIRN